MTFAATTDPDPDLSKLHLIMKIVQEIGLCEECHRKRAWYASQGRDADWVAGRP